MLKLLATAAASITALGTAAPIAGTLDPHLDDHSSM